MRISEQLAWLQCHTNDKVTPSQLQPLERQHELYSVKPSHAQIDSYAGHGFHLFIDIGQLWDFYESMPIKEVVLVELALYLNHDIGLQRISIISHGNAHTDKHLHLTSRVDGLQPATKTKFVWVTLWGITTLTPNRRIIDEPTIQAMLANFSKKKKKKLD